MKIRIKDVTGTTANFWLIYELQRAGFPEGTIVEDATYRPLSNSCEWSSGLFDCVAWIGETCEIIED